MLKRLENTGYMKKPRAEPMGLHQGLTKSQPSLRQLSGWLSVRLKGLLRTCSGGNSEKEQQISRNKASVQIGIGAVGNDGGIEGRASYDGDPQQNLEVGKFVHAQLLLKAGQLTFQ
jgi:hypothetical protein